jgi:Ser/Thr protein kinase RdoA (MazF antagonist)
VPPRGYRKIQPLTAEDCGNAADLCNAAAITLAIVAKKHTDIPKLLAALTFAQEAADELWKRRASLTHEQADQRQSTTPLPPDADRPGEEKP